MKRLLSTFLLAATCFASAASAQIDPAYNGLLKKYVNASGVNYAAWKANAADVATLERVVDSVAKAPASSAASQDQLAFHLNAYNAWILREKVREYPTNKKPFILSIPGYFDKKERITVAGKKMSFNELESGLIRPRFKDARIHFAINCASVSCPPLFNEAFDGKRLGGQLDDLAKKFVVKDVGGVKLSADKKTVAISNIFKWYADDFAPAGGAIAFINKYRPAGQPIPAGAKVEYQSYLWNLNESK